jgi:hypothetical protein
MRNRASGFQFRAAIADVRCFVQTAALLLCKRFTDMVAFVAGSTIRVTDNDLFTDIDPLTTKAFCAEIIRVVENPSGLHIIQSVKPDFFRDGSWILTEKTGYVLKGLSLVQGVLNVLTVI